MGSCRRNLQSLPVNNSGNTCTARFNFRRRTKPIRLHLFEHLHRTCHDVDSIHWGRSETPATLDVLSLSVGTDPDLALHTRKGTGYYKVPSLKGVWYRGHYLHDGSVASLEEMFDPDRLKGEHVPGGWSPPGIKARPIPGHEFGLKASPADRERLIAFLRTL